jgi:putative transcriptional regulator
VKPVDEITPGTFLLASPLLRDPNFMRTVVLVCDHGEPGTWGLVVNRRTALTFGELLENLPFPASSAGPVFWGGPCEPSRMQVLHRLRRVLPNQMEVCQGINLGIDADTFREVVGQSLLPGESLNAYVGYAGWGEGQLAAELDSGSWITCSAAPSVLFDSEPDDMWETVLRALGPEYARLMRMPIDPRLN